VKICVIIPALNEAAAITDVVQSIPSIVDRIIVVDNGSTDETNKRARAAGAETIFVEKPGYGRCCLAGIEITQNADIVVFMDGDGADDPSQLTTIIAPILANEADFVVGSRLNGTVETGALTFSQRFGNTLACFLMHLFWGGHFTDLGPFRAIKKTALDELALSAQTYGWTVEMQVRALKHNLVCKEVPVNYRRRIGTSKISGTVKGVFLAGTYILGTIGREAFIQRH